MKQMGDLMTHLRLVSRMAQARGIDLTRAFRDGDLSQAQWAGMVQRCRRCDWVEECPEWLDSRIEAEDRTPGACRNRTRFDTLRARQGGITESEGWDE